MSQLASVNEILLPEEQAACRNYFIAAAHNVSDGMAEPPYFRIWFRMFMLARRPTEPSKSTYHEVAIQASPAPVRLTTASKVTPTTSPPHAPTAVPAAVPPSQAPAKEPIKTSPGATSRPASTIKAPSPPTKPPTTGSGTQTVSRPPVPATSSNSAKLPIKYQDNASPPASYMPVASSKAAHNPPIKPPIVTPKHSDSERNPPRVLVRQTPAPATSQFATQSSSMPKSATSATVNGSSAPGAQVIAASLTTGNGSRQSTPAKTVAQTPARSLPPATKPIAGTHLTSIPVNGRPTASPGPAPRPAAPPPTNQPPPARASIPTAPSTTASTPSVPPIPKPPTLAYLPLPGLPLAAQELLGHKYEARGEPRITVYKHFYDKLLNFHHLHKRCTLNPSAPSPPTRQAPAVSQNGQVKRDTPTGPSNKRKHDDANGQGQPLDRYHDEENRSTDGRGGDEYSRGATKRYRSEYNQPSRPRGGNRPPDRYGDYYDGFSDDDW